MSGRLLVKSLLVGSVAIVSCGEGARTPDSGTDGGGSATEADAGSPHEVDAGAPFVAGRTQGGGCSTSDGSRVRIDIGSRGAAVPGCASFNFLRDDGGAGLFPKVRAPEGYFLREARYGLDCDFEEPDGTLRKEGTQPVTDAELSFQFVVVIDGKPRSYQLDGGSLLLGQRIFLITPGLWGTPAICPNR